MIRRVGENRGQIALLVAVILAVLVLLTAAAATLSIGQKRAGVFYRDRIQAYYTAEDGVEEVLSGIFRDWETLAEIPSGSECRLMYERPAPEGSLQVKACQRPVSEAVQLRLETTGTHRNAVRHVLFEGVLYPPLDFAAGIGAEEWAVEDPALEEHLTGLLSEEQAPELQADWFRRRAQSVTNGDAALDGGAVHGLYYVDGDLTVHGGLYEGQAVFFAAGRISITGDYRPRSSGDGCVVFLTPGDVYMAPGCCIQALVGAGGEVRLEEAAQLRGGLITNRLYAGPEAWIELDHDLISESLPVFSRGMNVGYWGDMYNVFYGRTD